MVPARVALLPQGAEDLGHGLHELPRAGGPRLRLRLPAAGQSGVPGGTASDSGPTPVPPLGGSPRARAQIFLSRAAMGASPDRYSVHRRAVAETLRVLRAQR